MFILSVFLIISYSLIIIFFIIGLFIYREKRVSKKKFISIIIPTLNEENNIKNIIYDLKKQSYPTNLFEIIIIDDNSKDNTIKIIKSYQRDMDNLKLLSSNDDKNSKLNFKKKLDFVNMVNYCMKYEINLDFSGTIDTNRCILSTISANIESWFTLKYKKK